MFLWQLRAMTASVVVYTFIRACDRVIHPRQSHKDFIYGAFMCHMWASRYMSLVAYTFAVLILNFIVGNRAIQIVCRYQHSFSTSVIAELAYLSGFGLVSIICMIPQTFLMQWDGTTCKCIDRDIPYAISVSLYAETFVRFGLTSIISVTILTLSCYKIFYWVRNTPPKMLSDTWNIIYLPGTTKEQMEAYSRPQGWMTASLCTIPLSANFLPISIYDTGYKFICAVGLCRISADSTLYRIDRLLTDVQLILFPIIITVYIPALRELTVRSCQRLISLGQKLPCMTHKRRQQKS
ncbi:unnamed protein product [Dibothriocephalus latus]|uniref:G-protein coupled receptors family 1 profile domain-containing protein n=1 Tax=Dibothriocephalus latus TaxID=60516 RepID=A0A3P7PB09_DIBLA|nr:unnamed protein product [Dibothriocephalus latus]